jgi:hypothetical protein
MIESPNFIQVVILPETVLKTVSLIQAVGFIYGGQSEFVQCSLIDDKIKLGDWCIELYPGIIIQHILSEHWWFHPNDEFPLEAAKSLISNSAG